MGLSLLSERFRRSGLVVALVLLVGMSASYAHHAMTAPLGWRAALADPTAHDGSRLWFPLYAVTAVDAPDRIRISKVLRDIPVVVDADGLEVGDTVSLAGRFDGEARLVRADQLETHRLRPLKRALGVVGLIFCAWMAPRRFRWQKGRLEIRG